MFQRERIIFELYLQARQNMTALGGTILSQFNTETLNDYEKAMHDYIPLSSEI